MKKLLVLLIFMASYAHAEIYTWTDKQGTSHYTNSIYEIPEKYRAKAKVLNLGIVEKNESTSPEQNAAPQSPAPVQQNQQVQPSSPAPQPQAVTPPREHPGWGYPGKRPRPSTE